MTERADQLFAAAMAGYSYAEFTASEPPVGRDEDAQPAEDDGEDSDNAVGSPVPATRTHP